MGRYLRVLFVVAAILSTSAGPALALQARSTRISKSSLQATVQGSDITNISGSITTNRKCIEGRTVTIKSSATGPFGAGLTNSQGFFSIPGSAPSTSEFVITVSKARVRKTICGSAKARHTFS